ncbi:hypothetical protein BN159_0426 [Streptomyces davaonensis JCM 4913]|uniref:Secreted protein n=1 Tax=Streptomyces davaonensis (strain DSM 101723 / JCM 4913 / KCC S-0913 / 768) TaxID=1214101 RepID=K4QVH7_STRDJ|nr:hypothetical protein [Streptomyces davaonensis]CCK24805.1 hypothetical protein BN159_0426 [Streptomyces davaonensis JCM 4913]
MTPRLLPPDHHRPRPGHRHDEGHGQSNDGGRRTTLNAWRRRGGTGLLTRRAAAALAVAACLALAAASCISRDLQAAGTSHAAASADATSTPDAQQTNQAAPLAQIQGQDSLVLTISSATRTSSGILTLRGTLKNTGDGTAVVPAALRGNEHHVARNGQSLGGATLVDFTGRKRYYVLRDTEGRPLTTTGLTSLKSAESVAVFMQFPAPPATTAQVDFHLPQFDTATLPIS